MARVWLESFLVGKEVFELDLDEARGNDRDWGDMMCLGA